MIPRLQTRCGFVAGLVIQAGLGFLLPGCADETRSGAPSTNVLLIVVDTLRADHVGCYGAARATTPRLDEFAAEAVVFRNAYATAPWTIPSVATMLTGLYPGSNRAEQTWAKLDGGAATLAEILAARGYATFGIVSNFLIGKRFGFDRGFDALSETNVGGARHVSSRGVTEQAIEAIERFGSTDRPMLLMVHYFDPHFAYMRHPEIGFAPERAGRLDGSEPLLRLREMGAGLSAEEIDLLRALYDEEIRSTDFEIGRLLDRARQTGFLDRSLVVVVADHGEAFLEHGWLGHTTSLHEELIRVPLMIRSPRPAPGGARAERVVEERVSLVSLAATILDACGIDPSGRGFQGRSFADLLDGGAIPGESVIYSEVSFNSDLPQDRGKQANQKAVIVGSLKLILDEDSGRVQLYNLQTDPLESEELSATRPELVVRLRGILDRQAAIASSRATVSEQADLLQEDIDRLRDLGYVDAGR